MGGANVAKVEKFVPSSDQRRFTLAIADGGSGFLGSELTLVSDEGRAQLWTATSHPVCRETIPGEVAMQIRAHGTDKILCSDERRQAVYLLRPGEAQKKDMDTGLPMFNDAWEATPDEDPPEPSVEDFL